VTAILLTDRLLCNRVVAKTTNQTTQTAESQAEEYEVTHPDEGEVGGSRHMGRMVRHRKLTLNERSLPSFRKSFVDVRVAIEVACRAH
jgi:hypothetical protein